MSLVVDRDPSESPPPSPLLSHVKHKGKRLAPPPPPKKEKIRAHQAHFGNMSL
jgi:hypothetical protein